MRRLKKEITPATKALGAPFACPGAPWGLSGLGCLPTPFVFRRGCDFIDFSRDHQVLKEFVLLFLSVHPI
jgi:hypothetical protein